MLAVVVVLSGLAGLVVEEVEVDEVGDIAGDDAEIANEDGAVDFVDVDVDAEVGEDLGGAGAVVADAAR